MQQQLIDQLRGIHYPPPPADDTWQLVLLLMLFVVGLAGLGYGILQRCQKTTPPWQSNAVDQLTKAKTLPGQAALIEAALTLRNTLPYLNNDDWTQRASGQAYLHHLDSLFNQDNNDTTDDRFFAHGPGQVFGNTLYRQHPAESQVIAAIDGLITRLKRYRK